MKIAWLCQFIYPFLHLPCSLSFFCGFWSPLSSSCIFSSFQCLRVCLDWWGFGGINPSALRMWSCQCCMWGSRRYAGKDAEAPRFLSVIGGAGVFVWCDTSLRSTTPRAVSVSLREFVVAFHISELSLLGHYLTSSRSVASSRTSLLYID